MKKKLHLTIVLLFIPAQLFAAEATFTWTANDKTEPVIGYVVSVETISTKRMVEYPVLCPAGMQMCCETTVDGLRAGTKYRAWAQAVGNWTFDDKSLVRSDGSQIVEFIADQ